MLGAAKAIHGSRSDVAVLLRKEVENYRRAPRLGAAFIYGRVDDAVTDGASWDGLIPALCGEFGFTKRELHDRFPRLRRVYDRASRVRAEFERAEAEFHKRRALVDPSAETRGGQT